MAGVGDEGSFALERFLEAGEHGVEGLAEAADLVVRGCEREAGVDVAVADRRRPLPHRLDGAQGGAEDEVSDNRGSEQRQWSAEQERDCQLVLGLLLGFE
ncbi:MAG: hypothetical protein R3C15_07430 [Thermoleophilia bacterium]